ncbi:uncharacterized protein LOC126299586 [Schistocerca gregaria]|uniref:uncharacterized protein LOC126299586 n=1 Tax=Schistocerca gregaria TaxID=7010 RepID=UPI00211E43E6|nr:uncharacterized protein LOC126299586 [Schistocerca gregaria]
MRIMCPRQLFLFLSLAVCQEGFLHSGSKPAAAMSATLTTGQKKMRSIDEVLEPYTLCVNIFGRTFADTATILYVLHGIKLQYGGWKLNISLIGSKSITEEEMSSKIATVYGLCRTLEMCLKEDSLQYWESICIRSANILKEIGEVAVDNDIHGTLRLLNEQSSGTSNSTRSIHDVQLAEILPPKTNCLWSISVLLLSYSINVLLITITLEMGRRFLPLSYVILSVSCLYLLIIYNYCINNDSEMILLKK